MERKVKIIQINIDPADACSFYRGECPNEFVERMTGGRIEFISKPSHRELAWNEIIKTDIVFMQRPHREVEVNSMINCKLLNIPVWIDYDDLLIDIPKENPASEAYEKCRKNIKFLLRNADVVTCSTERLSIELSKYTPNSEPMVINNAIPQMFFNKQYGRDKRAMLWRGGNTHVEDFHEYEATLVGAVSEYGIEPTICGYYHSGFIKKTRAHYEPPMDILSYFDFLNQRIWGLNVVLLSDNTFNRCKSNIAWLEGTFAGCVTIAPDFPEFKKRGVLTYSNAHELKDCIKLFVDASEDEVLKMWELSNDEIREKYSVLHINKQRISLIDSIMEGR